MTRLQLQPSRAAIFLACVALAGALLVAGIAVSREYHRTIDAERTRLATAAQAVEEHMQGTLRAIDNLLRYTAAQIAPADMHAFGTSPEGQRFIAEAGRLLPEIGVLFILDGEGNPVVSSLGTLPRKNFADREYFQELAGGGHPVLHIGRSVDSPFTGTTFFTVARALHSTDGAFAGVVVAGVNTPYFERFSRSFDLGNDGIIAIYRSDGAGILRHPFSRSFLTTNIPTSSLTAFDSEEPAVLHQSPIDGVRRLVAYREMATLPLYVVVGKTSADILAQWRRDAAETFAIVGAAALLALVLLIMLFRGLRRETAVLDELKASRDRIDMALRMVPVTLVEMDRDMRYTWVANPPPPLSREDILGRVHDDVFGQPMPELQAAKERALRTGQPARLELTVNSSGTPRHFEFVTEPKRSRAGNIVGLRSVATEVTDRVRERQALMEAKAAADLANQEKSRFLAAASHDLRQPLQALNLYHGLLAAAAPPDDRVIGSTGQCLGSLTDMLNDLLDLSKLQGGNVEVKPSVWEVGVVMANVAASIRPEAERKGIELRYLPCSICVNSDRVLFERIAINLMSNAVRYTDRGRVLVGFRRRAGAVELQVWDTGIGIPEDKLATIFDEFVQVGNPERSRDNGTGLGLAIVRRTADLLGTRIAVESCLGRGSVFRVSLPVAEQGAQSASADSGTMATARGMAMIIEDDPHVREALNLTLTASGYEVLCTSSAAEALEVLDDEAPARLDAVIADFRLPGGGDGVEAVQQVRERIRRALPAIILTGDIDPDTNDRITSAGLIAMLKPVRRDALMRTLAALHVTASENLPN